MDSPHDNDIATPKLSPALFNAYKTYKRDTDRVATWLAETARSLGFSWSPRGTAGNAPSSSARLKGKARKAAKQQPNDQRPDPAAAASDDTPSELEHNGEATTISASQFIACAQYIASANPPVSVPTRVIDWVCRAIHARRLCAAWFQSPAVTLPRPTEGATQSSAGIQVHDYDHGSAAESNRTHAHFIAILEQVVTILAPLVGSSVETSANGKAACAKPVTGVELLESRFALLDLLDAGSAADAVGDITDWEAVFGLVHEALSSASPTASPRKRRNVSHGWARLRQHFRVVCEQEDEPDFVIVLMLHLNHLDMLTQQVGKAWHVYHCDHARNAVGPGTLEHASLLTTAICDRVQDMCNDLTKMFPKLMSNHATYARLIFEHACAEHNREPWDPSQPPGEKKVFGIDSWPLANYCYLPMITVLERFRRALHANQVREMPDPGQPKCPCCGGDELRQRTFIDSLEYMVNSIYLALKEAETQCGKALTFESLPNPLLDAFELLERLPLSEPIPLFTLFVVQTYINISHQINRSDASRLFIRNAIVSGLSSHLLAVTAYMDDPPSKSGELHLPTVFQQMQAAPVALDLWLAYPLDTPDRIIVAEPRTPSKAPREKGRAARNNESGHSSQAPVDAACHDANKEALLTTLKTRRAAVFRVFELHPWLAGTVLVRAGLLMSSAAIYAADLWQSVLYAAYLYEAFRLHGLDQDDPSTNTVQDSNKREPKGIQSTLWWLEMTELMMCVGGKARVFFGKEPPDMHALWRTLNLTIENRSRTDVVFREHLHTHRNGRACGPPRSLRRIVDKNPSKPIPKSLVTLHGLFTERRRELVGQGFLERLIIDPKAKGGNLAAEIKSTVASLLQAVSPRIVPSEHKESDRPEYDTTRKLRLLFERLSKDLCEEFVPLLLPNVMLLHVQSVRILKYLREQIVERERIATLDDDCPPCRWKDSRLGSPVWNLIRALGGQEVTEPVLGESKAKEESEEALKLLVDVRNYIIEEL